MVFTVVLLSLLLLIICITYFKINTFLAFLIVSILTAIVLGIPMDKISPTVEKGIGSIMGGLTLIIVLGAMLGKLIASSGAAENIATVMVRLFGVKHLQWGMAFTGFIVGIPLFYGVGFVLLVPLIFSIVYKYKLPAVYIGLPMLAALSVTHGFIPPHPSPVALVVLFEANMGLTLIYGLLIAIPAIIIGGPLFSKTLKHITAGKSEVFKPEEMVMEDDGYQKPGPLNSFLTALLPVIMIILFTVLPYLVSKDKTAIHQVLGFLGSANIVMLIAIIYATFSLGIFQGRPIKEVMVIYGEAVKDIAMIRGCVGSATVAALTAASVLLPLLQASGVNPNLLVLAIGAGSLMFSHVNDSGFWMFKEYFGISVKDTFRSWSIMEAIVAVVGLIGVLILSLFI